MARALFVFSTDRFAIVMPIRFDEATIGPNPQSLGWFDVARDGRFLMSRPVDPAAGETRRLVLVQNWIAAMGK